jgi:hemerythrin superfamily protein
LALNAIQIVKKDHRAVEALFKQFERAEKAGRAGEMQRAVRALVKELSIHAAVEEQLLYPTLRQTAEDADDEVLEALEEHHLVKRTLSELEKMEPDDERFRPKVRVLMESVRHHVEEEEEDLLPRLQRAIGARELRELGDAIQTLKKAAPTRPHPAAPDTPPGNLVAGVVASLYDRGRDAVRDLAARGRERAHEAAGRERRSVRQKRDRAGKRGRTAGERGTRAARVPRSAHHEQPSIH